MTDEGPLVVRCATDPQVETAVWAILLAVGCALVLVVSEMVKNRK